MRTPTRVGVLAAACSVALLTVPVAHAAPPGDNGTVKIHDASTDEELRRNEPHVCTFYLDAFVFDGGQQVNWHIERWAPTAGVKGETVLSDSLTLDASGHGRTEDLSLPDGHYKLFWNFDGQKGSAKHKVFWTDCGDSAEGGTTPSGVPSGTPSASVVPSAEPSESSGTSESDGASGTSPSASSPAAAVPEAAPSAQGATGDLAETGNGAPVGLLSGAAAALLAAGGFLLFRRRRAVRD
ncbi:LPXTG cell wall anchor domain-containing protein [Streptomyces triticisoli]|jgi:LPXTG-motif cell wall-anchored protein|uniref:LPXTG cell wall anchor domain-containing protein n=1 Tax=Streptomyces triticisoli TaxID=2182797 RepID=UPI000DD9CA77|nr:LPXTG cell wall anchor domain-containing protein [Streptomyces triticisoli]